jgi:ATP-dependent DNA helicase DinG
MGYGRRLMAALPPMRKLASKEEFEEALDRLGQPVPAPAAAPW